MKRKKTNFTLVEIIVSMTVFSILLLVVSQFFSTVQRAWIKSSDDVMAFENASMALELITRDIHCVYYSVDIIPFWYKSQSGSDEFSNQSLNFISQTNFSQAGATSNLCEVKYQLYYTTTPTNSSAGWIMRSVTGDNSDDWNFYNNLTAGLTGSDNAFTANNDSSEAYQKLIPYVTTLNFTCYDKTGGEVSGTTNAVVAFPFYIQVDLSLMDKNSWQRWIDLGGEPHNLQSSGDIYDFRKKHERTYSKTVLIGDRGQYGW